MAATETAPQVRPAVPQLVAHEVRAIRSRDDDLEEIFLRYYRADGPG